MALALLNLPGAQYLTINSPDGADSSLNNYYYYYFFEPNVSAWYVSSDRQADKDNRL